MVVGNVVKVVLLVVAMVVVKRLIQNNDRTEKWPTQSIAAQMNHTDSL